MKNDNERLVAERQWELSQFTTTEIKQELLSRGFTVQDMTTFDETTGLLKYESTTSPTHYFDPQTHKLVDNSEAYKRASGGY